nr:ribonuclease H-like domain-containing protein [Tanacetum cinerariifolium]
MGKAKRSTFKTKTVPSSKGWLHLLHMDLCAPMRIESINGKKYILSFALLDNLKQHDTQPTLNIQPTLESTIPPINVNVEENNNNQADDEEFKTYEFINPFAPPGTEAVESSSRNIDTSNLHTFYQRHRSDYH